MDDALIAEIEAVNELFPSLEGHEVLAVDQATDALIFVSTENDTLTTTDIGEIERFGYLPISEEMTVYYGTGPQPPGKVSYRTVIPASGVPVVINFEDNQGLIIDARTLDAGWLPIDVVNWPEGLLGIVYLLIKMPPNSLTISWPEAACMPLPTYPYGYDMNCEFELRSWNAGQTITARLVSWYPFQD